MRDLGVMIKFVLADVIPAGEDTLKARLNALYQSVCYRPPECAREDWGNFCDILAAEVGRSNGVPWKEQLVRLVNDTEKIPQEREDAIKLEMGFKPEELTDRPLEVKENESDL